MPIPRLATALAALLAVGLAACSPAAAPGGDATATPTPETDTNGGGGGEDVDLCAVLTLEEVSAAAGVEATDADGLTTGTGQFSCNYNAADGTAVAGHTYTTIASAISPDDFFDANAAAEGAEEISGVGDRAVLVGDENFPMIWAMVGDNLYALSVIADNLDAEGRREATIDLARIAAGRLP